MNILLLPLCYLGKFFYDQILLYVIFILQNVAG